MDRALKVMLEYRIGVKPVSDSLWWPDLAVAKLDVQQLLRLSAELPQVYPPGENFTDPVEAVMGVAGILGLANY